MTKPTLPEIKVPSPDEWPASVASWQHTGQSGQFQVNVDLVRGAGRAGAIPGITLSYQTGRTNGIFGLGWSLNIPAFHRGDGRSHPRYHDAGPEADKFTSTEYGELVTELSLRGENWVPEIFHIDGYNITRFRSRIESSFDRIEQRIDVNTGEMHWLTISRDCVTRVYGRTRDTRIADPEDPKRIAQWLLEEQWDSHGNYFRYEYKRENREGIDSGDFSERNRIDTAQTEAQIYPKKIKWGNKQPHVASDWLFELVFDYGEHSDDSTGENQSWRLRPDAFSNYSTGFEVRTRRLCSRTMLFYHIPELGIEPTLARTHQFTYALSPAASLLTAVTLSSYQHNSESGTSVESLPSIDFTYTTEESPGPVQSIQFSNRRTTASNAVSQQWHDLEGTGLPGLLGRESGGALYYRKNMGNGVLGNPTILPSRPSLTDTQLPSTQSLEKLFGDSRSCLLDLTEGPGYQERMHRGGWMPFMPFPKTPSVPFSNGGTRNIDLDGDGRADLLLTGESGISWHQFMGRDGWAPQKKVATSHDTLTALGDRTGNILLADMTGDGLADLVQVRPGSVRYWPNLGYGRFGKPVPIANAPFLDAPDLFDPARVRLFDINGSGTADLIYLGREAVTCYPNYNGNSFGQPLRIDNLPLVTDLDSIDVIDLLGTGTGCLVWSSASPGYSERPLRYMELTGGRHPNMLSAINNNQGLHVDISFSTSTRYMLDDRRAGITWHTNLPFPVLLVSEIRETDLITGASQISSWCYRHGYYDEEDREMRGFAYVEHRVSQIVPTDHSITFGELIPDQVTKTWYHTGVQIQREPLENQLALEFYQSSSGYEGRPGITTENLPGVSPHQLLRALQSRPLRQEVYGTVNGEINAHPYTTMDYGYLLRALQPSMNKAYPSVIAFSQETVERIYECSPDDPRTAQSLVLSIDRLGCTTRQATIAYPRLFPAEPEQGKMLCTIEERDFVHCDTEPGWFRAGIPIDSKVFEISPLSPPRGNKLFQIDLFKQLVSSPDILTLPFEQDTPVTGTYCKRLIKRSKIQYWKDDLSSPAPFGIVGRAALVYEEKQAVFTEGLLNNVYDRAIINDEFLASCGYVYDDGIWWAKGTKITYDISAFYQPVLAQTSLNANYTVSYDAYSLFVTATNDPVNNTQRAQYDYGAMAPSIITNANGGTVSTAYSPLGLPVAIAVAGINGEGDSLTSPTTRIERNFFAWQHEHQPVNQITVSRAIHADPSTLWERNIRFLNGQGKEIQTKKLAESAAPGLPGRWVTEKSMVVLISGAIVRAYNAGFTLSEQYSPEAEIQSFPITRFRLDAPGRVIEVRYPGGTITKTVQTPWRKEHWDANDAVNDSDWLHFRHRTDATDQERAEADAALAHANTPTVEHFNAAGQTFLLVEDGGSAGQSRTENLLAISGQVKSIRDPRGVVTEQRSYDMIDRSLRVQSLASGTNNIFYNAEGSPVYTWGARGHEQLLLYDELGRLKQRKIRLQNDTWRVAELLVWGEQAPTSEAYYRGQLYLHYDGAGQLKITGYDFQGRPLHTERKYRSDLTVDADWNIIRDSDAAIIERTARSQLINDLSFISTVTYDAMGRVLTRATPDGSINTFDYNIRGLLAGINITIDGITTPVLQQPVYDATGRQIRCRLGNGLIEADEYDDKSGFLKRRFTKEPGEIYLRDLHFNFDATGNILAVSDAGQQTRFFRNAAITPDRNFRYDALYRLVEARGREAAMPVHSVNREYSPPLYSIPHNNDINAVRQYTEHYSYDLSGNLTMLEHRAGPGGSWTVQYEMDTRADRITGLSDSHGTSIPGNFIYDNAGNATTLGGLTDLLWNDQEQLSQVDLGGGGTAYYVYDGKGKRAAKIIVRQDGSKEERYYLDGYEYYRRVDSRENIEHEETSLHVSDNGKRMLLVERRRRGGDQTWLTIWRYQHCDQVGSCSMETDENMRVLSFEEFRPYGTTAYHAIQPVTPPKRYRFGGQENDTETGLTLYGVRYYASWLGRWISPDPGGMLDGTNRYWFCRGNAITYADPTGFQSRPRVPAPTTTQPTQPFLLDMLGYDTANMQPVYVLPPIAAPPTAAPSTAAPARQNFSDSLERAVTQGDRDREHGREIVAGLTSRINHWTQADYRLLHRAGLMSNVFEDPQAVLRRAQGNLRPLVATERILRQEDEFRARRERDPRHYRPVYEQDGSIRGYNYELGGNINNPRIAPELRIFYDPRGQEGTREVNGNLAEPDLEPTDLLPLNTISMRFVRSFGRIARPSLRTVRAMEREAAQAIEGGVQREAQVVERTVQREVQAVERNVQCEVQAVERSAASEVHATVQAAPGESTATNRVLPNAFQPQQAEAAFQQGVRDNPNVSLRQRADEATDFLQWEHTATEAEESARRLYNERLFEGGSNPNLLHASQVADDSIRNPVSLTESLGQIYSDALALQRNSPDPVSRSLANDAGVATHTYLLQSMEATAARRGLPVMPPVTEFVDGTYAFENTVVSQGRLFRDFFSEAHGYDVHFFQLLTVDRAFTAHGVQMTVPQFMQEMGNNAPQLWRAIFDNGDRGVVSQVSRPEAMTAILRNILGGQSVWR